MLNQLPKIENKTGWPWDKETLVDIYSKDIDWPKISIVTPSFNQGEYIEETIRSILLQNYPNLEYIIIDGGSTDNTVEIIKKYEKYLTYWVSETDRGQAHAINKGLEKCTGEVFNWINSDDYLESGSLFEIGKHFAQNKQAHVLCGFTHCYFQETGETSHTYRMGVKKNVTSTLLNIEMNQPGTFYKTEIIKQLEGANESLHYVFDNEIWMRYLLWFGQRNVVLIKDLLAHFRQHGSSKSFGQGFENFYKEQQAVLEHLANQTKLPSYLMDYLKKQTSISNYISRPWNISFLNVKKFHAWFANKYIVTLYNDQKKNELAQSLKQAIMYRTITLNRKNLSVLLRQTYSMKMINRLKSHFRRILRKKPIFDHLFYKRWAKITVHKVFNGQHIPTLILTMGKVGSTAIYGSLKETELADHVLHLHFLSDEINLHKKFSKKTGFFPYHEHLYLSSEVRRKLKKHKEPINIITLVRDPIALIVSNLFQNPLWASDVVTDSSGNINKDKAYQYLYRKIKEKDIFKFFDEWFDKELKTVTGVDVFAEDYNKQLGYKTYKNNQWNILCMWNELLETSGSEVVSDFLKLTTSIEIKRLNVRSGSNDADAYKFVLEQLKIDRQLCEEIYRRPLATYFYPEEKITGFIEKWAK